MGLFGHRSLKRTVLWGNAQLDGISDLQDSSTMTNSADYQDHLISLSCYPDSLPILPGDLLVAGQGLGATSSPCRATFVKLCAGGSIGHPRGTPGLCEATVGESRMCCLVAILVFFEQICILQLRFKIGGSRNFILYYSNKISGSTYFEIFP
jgi:hypothetical protein